MQHLDEHTLAFYAMGAESAARENDAIEAHLRECHGCRAQLEELRGINNHFAESSTFGRDASNNATPEALVSFPRAIRRRPDSYAIRSEPRMLTRAERFITLVRRHPIGTGAGVLALAFLAVLSIPQISKWGESMDQPAFVRWNTMGTVLEICGNEGKVWEIPVASTDRSTLTLERFKDICTRIADIDGDGSMEVLSATPYSEGGRVIEDALRVFDSEGRVVAVHTFRAQVDFQGISYTNNFAVSGITVRTSTKSGKKEILVGLLNGRSPSCLVRMDIAGEVLGEYWHFGWLHAPTMVELEGEYRSLILLNGCNDVTYRSDGVFPALTILDPERIAGRTESVQSRGFGYPASEAELYYVKCGNVDPDLVSGVRVQQPGFLQAVRFASDSSFYLVCGFLEPADFPDVMYTFDKRMDVFDVWLSDSQRLGLNSKFLTRKSPAGLDEFTQDLKSKVRYWDGTEWKREPVKISHTGSLSVPTLP